MPAAARERPGAGPALPLAWRVTILAIVVVQFLVAHGAVWRHMFDWDRSILASYATIPAFVLAALALRRRLAFVPWLVHTVEIAGFKFAVTAGFLVVLLITRGEQPPPRPAAVETTAPPSTPAKRPPAPPPSRIPPGSTGELEGRVARADGTGLAGALVYVHSGLEHLTFAPHQASVVIENHGRGPVPPIAGGQIGQSLTVRSVDGRLHTLLLRRPGARQPVLNLPMPASQAESSVVLEESMLGVNVATCTVHGEREGRGTLVVLGHPFFVATDATGHFQLAGVPAGNLTVRALHPSLDEMTDEITLRLALEPGERESVEMTPGLGNRK